MNIMVVPLLVLLIVLIVYYPTRNNLKNAKRRLTIARNNFKKIAQHRTNRDYYTRGRENLHYEPRPSADSPPTISKGRRCPDDKFYEYEISDTELDPSYIEVVRDKLEDQDRQFKEINERLLLLDGYSVHSEEGRDVAFPVIAVDKIMSYILAYEHPGAFPYRAFPTAAGDTYCKALHAIEYGEDKIGGMLEVAHALEIEVNEPFLCDKKNNK
jgi:hypothetical protein